jgi:hypothetical protein
MAVGVATLETQKHVGGGGWSGRLPSGPSDDEAPPVFSGADA